MTLVLGLANSAAAVTTTTMERYKGGKLDEMRKARISNYVSKMEQRLDVLINNLDKAVSKMEQRMSFLLNQPALGFTNANPEVVNFNSKLANAKTKIQDAKTALENLKKNFKDALASTTPKVAFSNIKEKMVKDVVAKIKSGRQAVVEARQAWTWEKPYEATTSTPAATSTSY